MPQQLPPHIRELAEFQQGILTTSQATAGGVPRHLIRTRIRQASWQRVYPGVYAVFSGELGRPAALWAAVLQAGPGAMLSHQTAAELTGLADSPSTLIHVTVPACRRPARIPGVRLHRSAGPGLARHPAAAPARTRIEETVLDLTDTEADFEAAFCWVIRAVGRRLTTQSQLQQAVAMRSRLRWRRELAEALGAAADGIHSGLEHRYLRAVEQPHALPRATRQARARRGGRSEYRDVLYAEYGVAVELDGRAAHPGDLRWNDIHRDNAAAADGIITLRYGWLDVSQQPCRVAAQIAGCWRTAVTPGPGRAGPAAPCPAPCCPPQWCRAQSCAARRSGQGDAHKAVSGWASAWCIRGQGQQPDNLRRRLPRRA